jgi:hypothetical protein
MEPGVARFIDDAFDHVHRLGLFFHISQNLVLVAILPVDKRIPETGYFQEIDSGSENPCREGDRLRGFEDRALTGIALGVDIGYVLASYIKTHLTGFESAQADLKSIG